MERHVFSPKGVYNPKDTNNEAWDTHVLFLNDSSLVIRQERRSEGMHGGYYHKVLNTYIYKAYTNRHGERYLRSFKVTKNGLTFSNGLADLRRDHFLYSSASGGGFHCKEMVEVIEKHLSKILGFNFSYQPHPKLTAKLEYEVDGNAPEFLLYPFLRKQENRDFLMSLLDEDKTRTVKSEVSTVLNFDWKGVRGLNFACRNSNTIEDFIKCIAYKSAIRTDDDLKCLMANPSLLRVFSHIDLKMGAKEAMERGYTEVFHDSYQYMTIPELYGFRFLLANLPKDRTIEVLDLVNKLASFRKEQEHSGVIDNLTAFIANQNSYSYSAVRNGIKGQLQSFLKLVPLSKRREFALTFFEEFKKDYTNTEKKWKEMSTLKSVDRLKWSNHRNDCFVKVMDAYLKAYSAKFLKTITSDSTAKCVETAMDLFGVDISEDSTLKTGVITVEELDATIAYYDFRDHVSERFNRNQPKTLFGLFKSNSEVNDVWNNSFFGPSQPVFAEYMGMRGFSRLIFASDLDKTLKKIASKIDSELTKLGQETTPRTRMIFLESSSWDRKYKVNWRYYLLGVPVSEVHLYKKAGIRSKRDITFWLESKESLPDETYKELLNDFAYGAKSDSLNGPSSWSF